MLWTGSAFLCKLVIGRIPPKLNTPANPWTCRRDLTHVVPTKYAPDISGVSTTAMQIGGAIAVAAFGHAISEPELTHEHRSRHATRSHATPRVRARQPRLRRRCASGGRHPFASDRTTRWQHSSPDPVGHEITPSRLDRQGLTFPSGEDRCAAWFHPPARRETDPDRAGCMFRARTSLRA